MGFVALGECHILFSNDYPYFNQRLLSLSSPPKDHRGGLVRRLIRCWRFPLKT